MQKVIRDLGLKTPIKPPIFKYCEYVIVAMQQQFQAEIDEAPYIAKLRSVLEIGVRFPTKPAQVRLRSASLKF